MRDGASCMMHPPIQNSNPTLLAPTLLIRVTICTVHVSFLQCLQIYARRSACSRGSPFTIQTKGKETKLRMSSVGINDFYRQKKKCEATIKASSKQSSGNSVAADLQGQKEALTEQDEEMLRQFDLDMRYGPCLGLSRMERWDRAFAMGVDPPKEVEAILGRSSSALDCLWEGRV